LVKIEEGMIEGAKSKVKKSIFALKPSKKEEGN